MTGLQELITKILSMDAFKNKPPVLIDVGASGTIHPEWETICKHSVCIAFDPDYRASKSMENDQKEFLKKIIVSAIVADQVEKDAQKEFYLTREGCCSSSLEPLIDKLQSWEFSEWFEISKKTQLPATTLDQALKDNDYDYIDWLKFDTQGTDLRIFNSLSRELQDQILAVDFEPGIIDTYKEEDKLFHILSTMDLKPFWLASMVLRGSHRIQSAVRNSFDSQLIFKNLPASPGWAEATYLNNFLSIKSVRDILLGWVFASILKQHGFAIELASKGYQLSDQKIFKTLESFSREQIKYEQPTKPQVLSGVCKILAIPVRNLLAFLEKNTNQYKWISMEERSLVQK